MEDCIGYYINDFVPAVYNIPKYPFHFLVPTDKTLYQEPHNYRFSEKIKGLVLRKLRESDQNDSIRYGIEAGYVKEWDNVQSGIYLLATTQNNEIGFLSFALCKDCIWGIYPHEKNYARLKVMGSEEAQKKIREFIHSFFSLGVN